MYTFVGDMLMFPEDPLGKKGPRLDEFLKFPSTNYRIDTTANKDIILL